MYTLVLISLIALACTNYAILRSIYDTLGKERKGRKLSVVSFKGKKTKKILVIKQFKVKQIELFFKKFELTCWKSVKLSTLVGLTASKH